MPHSYRVHQKVEATVEKVLSFGVFARLEDGTRAYIRRRNLDLDADAEPEEVVEAGQRISGVIVALNANGGHIEISRRAALPDPWPAFAKDFHAGDVVVGEVRRLLPAGAFVRLAAGVNGYLPLAEMAPWPVEKPEDLLWMGDRVEATILSFSLASHKLTLSVRDRLAARERALDLYEDLFPQGPATGAPDAAVRFAGLRSAAPAPPLAGKLLILEDNARLRHSLGAWFHRHGLEVSEVGSLAAAREQYAAMRFDFLLLDLNLPDGDGLELAGECAQLSQPPHIFIMSSIENLIERLDALSGCEIAQIFPKPLDMVEIQNCLVRLARGEGLQVFKPAGANQSAAPGNEPSLPSLMEDDNQVGIQARLKRVVAQVHQSTQAENTILFSLDTVTQTYTIQAMVGPAVIAGAQLYSLGNSPVKDVLRSGAPLVEHQAQSGAKARYQKLLDLLPFESCLGLPLRVQGEYTCALFFFHSQPEVFSPYRQRDARAGAYWITALLEEAAIEHRIQALSPLLISGQLASGFGHEIANQTSNLELEIMNHLAAQNEAGAGPRVLASLLERVQELKYTSLDFQRILWSENQAGDCDLHTVLEHASQSVKPFARKFKTKIRLDFCPDLGQVRANPVALQQVFANVLLNAIQQIELKFEKKAWNGARRVEVHTCHSQVPGRIDIRIQDTGPGIHRCLWKKVFRAGYSTRGGSGMGLYISQSILQQSGGSIAVEESVIPFGTTFLIRLPVQKNGGAP